MLAHKNAPAHTFCKDGIFYFRRRVPSDLSQHYTSRQIAFSLRTTSAAVAASRAARAAQQLDEHWYHLRIKDRDLPGKHLLRMQHSGAVPMAWSGRAAAAEAASVTLSEAVAIYLKLKGHNNRPVTFTRAAERSCGYVIDICGDKDLLTYTKADATRFRDALVERGLAGTSITRVFGTVRSVINFAASEIGVTLSNPFTGVYYDRQAGVKDRAALPLDAIRKLQRRCIESDDDLRWLVALVPFTPQGQTVSGARAGSNLFRRRPRPRGSSHDLGRMRSGGLQRNSCREPRKSRVSVRSRHGFAEG